MYGEQDFDAFKKMMDWMIGIVDKYGWWGVFAFSSFPNALFDVCGTQRAPGKCVGLSLLLPLDLADRA